MDPLAVITLVGLVIAFACAIGGPIYLSYAHKRNLERLLAPKKDEVGVTLAQRNAVQIQEMRKDIARLPSKVLDSVTSSGNNYKGRLGELIAYLKLYAEYDKVIVFGDVTDFIGIKFPKEGIPGTIDFIDVKNGPHAKLTKDQSRFKKLIEAKRIRFVKLKINTEID